MVTKVRSSTLDDLDLTIDVLTGTAAEFNTAVSDDDFVTLTGTETLTNKTLTTPIIATISNTGALTLPTSTDTLVGKATTDTLTNKSVDLSTNTVTGTLAEFNTAVSDATLTSLTGSETLTNKTIVVASNTITTAASGNLAATELDTALAELQSDIDTRVNETSTTGSASLPVGTVAQRDGSPADGYIRYNSDNTKYEGYGNSAWSPLGGGATGGGSDTVFVENQQTVTTDYTIPSGSNASSVGAITINSGITVTVSASSVWVVL